MIIDTSAVLAVLRGEPEREAFLDALGASGPHRMSSGTWLESSIVVDRLGDPVLSRRLDDLLAALGIEVVPVSAAQARLARGAYRDYGKGTGHPARLNFADCFAYALASESKEPLLFKGDDFVHTDLVPAVPF